MSGIYTIPTQNALQSTLDAELAAGGTSMTLADDWSSYFSGVSANNPAILVIDRQDANGTNTPSKREYVKVTNVSGATFTIGTRGMNGSTDQVHSVGARVECVTDVETWKSIKDTFEVEHVSTDGTHDFSSSNVDFQGISLGAGTTMTAIKDEDNMASDSATALATQQSIKAYADTLNKQGKKTITSNSDGATITFDLDASNIHTVTLGDNRTLALSNASVGQVFIINLVQDGTGSRTVTWFSTIKWAGGSAPTLTTTANKTDSLGFICTSSGNYLGYVVGQNL